MSLSDYYSLTDLQKMFIRKEWENMTVELSQFRLAEHTFAIGNALRKKGRSYREMWKKRPKPVDKQKQNELIEFVKDYEAKKPRGESGLKTWVERVLAGSGLNIEHAQRKAGKSNG